MSPFRTAARAGKRRLVWFTGGCLTLALYAPGCRLGYEVFDKAESVSLGGAAGDGDGDGGAGAGDGGVAGDGDGDGSGGSSTSDGGTGGDSTTGGQTGAGGDPGTGGLGMGGDPGTGGTGSGGMTFTCSGGEFFCSGFEVPVFDEWTDIFTAHTTCIVEPRTTQVFAGSDSLYTYAPGNRDRARVNYVFPAPVTSGDLSLRAWFYLPSTVTLDYQMVILELHDPNEGALFKSSINLGPGDTVILETTTGISPGVSTSGAGAFNRDAWNCAVLRADVADPGSLQVEINGGIVHDISGGDVHPSLGFARALVGPYKFGNQDIEMYFDEVSVDTSVLTCP